jgi:Fic family protein
MNANHWRPIEDLPQNWPDYASSELSSLASIWKEQSEKLKTSNALRKFNEELKREWAIETGIIENLYTLDRGVTRILIERGLEESLVPHGATDKPVQQVISILKDQQAALDGIFDFIKANRKLSTSYIKELHQVITEHQDFITVKNTLGQFMQTPLLKGAWKTLPNNPERPVNGLLHKYCPPEQVSSEMDRLMEMHDEHIRKGVPPEVESAWLHHRFTQIHPFQDGNGRIARTLASLVFIKAGWFPLVVARDMRGDYIAACEKADEGDLKELVRIFISIQKKSFMNVLRISETILHEKEPIAQVISAVIDKFRERKTIELIERQNVFSTSKNLEDISFEQLSAICAQLKNELSIYDSDFHATVVRSDQNSGHWFKNQIVKVANELGYFADTRTYAKWIRLKILEQRQVELLLSFHSLGVEFLGILAVSAFIEYRDRYEEESDNRIIDGPYPICNEVFQFAYSENMDSIKKRFSNWLSNSLLTGLDQWRRQL